MRSSSWLVIVLVLTALVGCAGTPDLSAGGGPPRCDRTGNEDQRRAC